MSIFIVFYVKNKDLRMKYRNSKVDTFAVNKEPASVTVRHAGMNFSLFKILFQISYP